MRTPILMAVLAGALVLGGTAAVAATMPPSSPPADIQHRPMGNMRQMHEQMLGQYPEMGQQHERMLDYIPGMRGLPEQMMGGF